MKDVQFDGVWIVRMCVTEKAHQASSHLQVHSGGDAQVEADIHFGRHHVIGQATFHHGHIDGGDVTQSEALTGVKPVRRTQC